MRRRTRRRIILCLTSFIFIVEIILRIQNGMFSSPSIPESLIAVELHHVTEDFNGAYWSERDFHGDYFNIDNGVRHTVAQPTNAAYTVWLFGNSTLFGMYNADTDTAASQLQTLLNQSGYRVRVVNLATKGQNASGELARLHDTPIQRGDVIVFVDGLIDAEIMMACDPNNYALAIMKVGCEHLDDSPIVLDPAVGTRYWAHIHAAEAWSKQHGAIFYHFLQPERDETYRYALIVGNATPLQLPRDAFVDDYHLTADGNRQLARAMWDAIGTF